MQQKIHYIVQFDAEIKLLGMYIRKKIPPN